MPLAKFDRMTLILEANRWTLLYTQLRTSQKCTKLYRAYAVYKVSWRIGLRESSATRGARARVMMSVARDGSAILARDLPTRFGTLLYTPSLLDTLRGLAWSLKVYKSDR